MIYRLLVLRINYKLVGKIVNKLVHKSAGKLVSKIMINWMQMMELMKNN